MHNNKFSGTGVAIVTPFRKDGSIDFQSFAEIIDFHIAHKIEYIVALGTTGESVTLNKQEKQAVANFVIEQVEGRVPVVIGMGGNNTAEIQHQIKEQDFEGIDAILSVSPYYNKPNQRGIYEHYKILAHDSPVPVILYNVPGRTGKNINAETTIDLAQIDNIIGIKEASCNLDQITRICKHTPEDFLVVSGDDAFTLPIIAMGGSGVISVTANAFPAEFSEMVRKALDQDFQGAREINFKLLDVMKYHFIEGNPTGVKASLSLLNKLENNLRRPLVPMSGDNYQQLKSHIQALGYEI